MTSVCIVIPMKDPAASKQRLRHVMSGPARQALALRLYRRTLAFFRQNFVDYTVLVVTGSGLVEQLANEHGAEVLKQPSEEGLCAAVNQAAQWSLSRGFQSQLYIPADIAWLDADEVRTVLSYAGDTPLVVLCPAGDQGTNALLTTPPNVIPFRFGWRSSRAHSLEAQRKHIPVKTLRLPNLTFDVDTPADLFEFNREGTYWNREVIG